MRKLEIEEYKAIVVQILVKIDRICRENNLKYMLMFGTLIGAVRHHGFIPWDDDIDIAMPRADYCRLMEIIRQGEYGINFISIENNADTIYPFGKICDIRTKAKEKNFKSVEGYGAFVDVFPLDYLPEDPRERKAFCRKCNNLIRLITHSARIDYSRECALPVRLARTIAFYTGKLFNTQSLIRRLEHLQTECNKANQGSSHMGIPWGFHADELYPSEMLADVTEAEFEGYSLFIPAQYDSILKMRYGDYMKLPPEKERVYSHSIDCYIDD